MDNDPKQIHVSPNPGGGFVGHKDGRLIVRTLRADPELIGSEVPSLMEISDPKPAQPLYEINEHFKAATFRPCMFCALRADGYEWESPIAVDERTLHFNSWQTAIINSGADGLAQLTGNEAFKTNRVAAVTEIVRLFVHTDPVTASGFKLTRLSRIDLGKLKSADYVNVIKPPADSTSQNEQPNAANELYSDTAESPEVYPDDENRGGPYSEPEE